MKFNNLTKFYSSIEKSYFREGVRTSDFWFTNPTLYRLGYQFSDAKLFYVLLMYQVDSIEATQIFDEIQHLIGTK